MEKKRKKKKKLFAVILAVILALAAFIGCSDLDDEEYAETEAYPGETPDSGTTSDTAQSSDTIIVSDGQNLSLYDNSDIRAKKSYDSAKTVTVLCYVNGSNLETDDGEATGDISEILAAGYNSDVNILIQTMGTKKWSSKLGIASDRSQRYRVAENGLELVGDDLGQLDCTAESTLEDFIKWGVSAYPADRYILMFWDHGGGPVYGFGYDDNSEDDEAALTIDEMQTALKNAGIFFDFIGMDCCIMSCMEMCCSLYDYCDYMILSEDFESGLGWSYEGWISALEKNPAIATTDLARIAIDDFVNANAKDSYEGDSAILALLDESVMKVLFTAWQNFAYANKDTLLENNYSQAVSRKAGNRILPVLESRHRSFWDGSYDYSDENYSMSDYYITDIMAVAQNIDSDESTALSSAVYNAVVYCNATSDENGLTGLSVTLPYGDNDFYLSLKTIFTNCGIDSDYISWLADFTDSSGAASYYNYDDWDDEWNGWDDYSDDYNWDDWDSWDESEDYGWCDTGYDYPDEEYYYDDYTDGYYSDDYSDDGYYYDYSEDSYSSDSYSESEYAYDYEYQSQSEYSSSHESEYYGDGPQGGPPEGGPGDDWDW